MHAAPSMLRLCKTLHKLLSRLCAASNALHILATRKFSQNKLCTFEKYFFALSTHDFAAICMDEKVSHLNTNMNEFTGNSVKMINKMVYAEFRFVNFGFGFRRAVFICSENGTKMMTKARVTWIIRQKSDFKSPKAWNFLLLNPNVFSFFWSKSIELLWEIPNCKPIQPNDCLFLLKVVINKPFLIFLLIFLISKNSFQLNFNKCCFLWCLQWKKELKAVNKNGLTCCGARSMWVCLGVSCVLCAYRFIFCLIVGVKQCLTQNTNRLDRSKRRNRLRFFFHSLRIGFI